MRAMKMITTVKQDFAEFANKHGLSTPPPNTFSMSVCGIGGVVAVANSDGTFDVAREWGEAGIAETVFTVSNESAVEQAMHYLFNEIDTTGVTKALETAYAVKFGDRVFMVSARKRGVPIYAGPMNISDLRSELTRSGFACYSRSRAMEMYGPKRKNSNDHAIDFVGGDVVAVDRSGNVTDRKPTAGPGTVWAVDPLTGTLWSSPTISDMLAESDGAPVEFARGIVVSRRNGEVVIERTEVR